MANYTTDGFSNGVNTTVIGRREKRKKDEACREMESTWEGAGEHEISHCGEKTPIDADACESGLRIKESAATSHVGADSCSSLRGVWGKGDQR